MKVETIMKRQVQTCQAHQTLNDAVHVFWEKDCGVIPVLDGEQKLVGILTDRDAAVSAYFRGESLKNIAIAEAMGRNVLTVRGSDDVEDALELMRTHQVRRLPVVDADGRIEGILSLSDVFHAALKDERLKPKRLVRAFAAICGWREEKRTVVLDIEIKPAAGSKAEPKAALPKAKAKPKKTKSPRPRGSAR